ncbi:MAG: DoxX family protein [Calditrichaeota bacterium]|nr:DoxX family protein [Calditrichota bacterium]
MLRISLGLMLAAHGVIRIYAGTVGDFGEFLNNSGFPFGTFIAWGITSFEIIGGATLALGHFHKLICLGFIIQLLMGIFLVHLANGWFVVGYSSGGVEYSVLLIICFFVIASTAAEK